MMTWNFCPSCGHRIYQHDTYGCTHETQQHHIIRITDDGWTLKHPLAEREQDKLFDCKIHQEIQSYASYYDDVGDYAIIENSNGGWSFEPVDKATEKCDCSSTNATLYAP